MSYIHLQLVGLPLALDGFVFDLGEGVGLAIRGQFQSFTGTSALFKLLGEPGAGVVADVLDPPGLNLDGPGFLGFVLVDLGAHPQPLDGQAGLAGPGLLVDQVLEEHGLGDLGGLSSDNPGQFPKGSGNVFLPNTFRLLLLVPSLILSGDS